MAPGSEGAAAGGRVSAGASGVGAVIAGMAGASAGIVATELSGALGMTRALTRGSVVPARLARLGDSGSAMGGRPLCPEVDCLL